MANTALNTNAFQFQFLMPLGVNDLNTDKSSPGGINGGAMGFMNSSFGPRVFRYGQNRSGSAMAVGSLASAVGNTSGVTAATLAAGTNTTTIGTTSGLTANVHVGGLLHVNNSTAGTGVAPEGEASVVVANTATQINLDPELPLSATLTSGDTVSLLGVWNLEAAAASDKTYVCYGVVAGRDGLSNNNFGWFSSWGRTPNVNIEASTAVVLTGAFIAGTALLDFVAASGSAPADEIVAKPIAASNSDIVSDKTLVYMLLSVGAAGGTLDVLA